MPNVPGAACPPARLLSRPPCHPALPPAVFTEAEIRASLVFQLSKLSSLVIKVSRLVV